MDVAGASLRIGSQVDPALADFQTPPDAEET
jgi:hypothetical protein